MGNPIKMDDLGVPLFLETPICLILISFIVKCTRLRPLDPIVSETLFMTDLTFLKCWGAQCYPTNQLAKRIHVWYITSTFSRFLW